MIEVTGVQVPQEFNDMKLAEKWLARLPEKRALQLGQIKKRDGFYLSLTAEVLARKSISEMTGYPFTEISIFHSDKGKPYVSEPGEIHFNNSHSGQWVVCAVSFSELGIDTEKIRPVNRDLAKRYFTETEYRYISDKKAEEWDSTFMEIWTAKEAYLKCLGKGLTLSLRSFSILTGDGKIRIRNNTTGTAITGYNFQAIKGIDGHVTTLCAPANEKSCHFTTLDHRELFEV